MSSNPVTKFDLVNANDMTPMISLNEAYGRSLKPVFNGPGSFSFSLALDAEAAFLVAMRSTGVKITRNDRPIWSGGVTNVVKSAQSNTMQVTAIGWLEEFDHRFVRKDEEVVLSFVGTVGGAIVGTLIDTCNAQLDTSSVVRPLRVSSGGYSDTQVRNRSYHVGDNYGASIRELSTIENGVDFSVDPLTRVLTCRAPTEYYDLTSIQFGWGVGPNNLADVVESGDGANLFNRENVVTASGIVTVADDQVAIGSAGVMLEEWNSLSDVNEVTIAAAYANAELVVKRNGLITYQLTPLPYGDVQRPYADFEWGDKCYFSVDQGALQISKQAVRMFAGTINYSDEGDEIISELEVAMA